MIANDIRFAVGYARRSTDLQERSLPDQKAAVERWARDHGYRILRWFVDDAISGTSARGRDQFTRLIHEAENGRDFDAVLCYDMSRFSRGGTNETGYYIHRLRLAGVETHFTAEGIPEGDEGELLQGVKSWQARQYSVKLSRDSIRGQHSTVTVKHSAMGGRSPYGYDRQYVSANGQVLKTVRTLSDGRRQEFGPDGRHLRFIDPKEKLPKKMKSDIVRLIPGDPKHIAVVRDIFEMCAKGLGFRSILIALNAKGISGPMHARWNQTAVKSILQNPCYRGALAWNRRTFGKIHEVASDGSAIPKKVAKTTRNPKDRWIIIEKVHEAIVPPDLFWKAHEQMAKRRNAGGLARPTQRYLLSGLVRCRHCGHNFWGCVLKNSAGEIRYYADGGYRAQGIGVCKATHIQAVALDRWVLDQLRATVLADKAGVERAIEQFVKAACGRGAAAKAQPDRSKELADLNKRIKTTVALLSDNDLADVGELRTALVDLKRRRETLEADVANKPASPKTIDPDRLRAWARERIADLARALKPGTPMMEARAAVHAFIPKIEIDPDRKVGTLFLPRDTCSALQSAFVRRDTSASKNLTEVIRFDCQLRRHGVPLWRDRIDMAKGTATEEEIRRAGDEALGFTFYLTKDAAESEWVRVKELGHAIRNAGLDSSFGIVPVFRDDRNVVADLILSAAKAGESKYDLRKHNGHVMKAADDLELETDLAAAADAVLRSSLRTLRKHAPAGSRLRIAAVTRHTSPWNAAATDLAIDWSHLYPPTGGRLPDNGVGATQLLPPLVRLVNAIGQEWKEQRVQVVPHCHPSLAVATGFALRRGSGFDLEVLDHASGARLLGPARPDAPVAGLWVESLKEPHATSRDIALAIGVSRDVAADAARTLAEQGVDIGAIVSLTPPGGPSNAALPTTDNGSFHRLAVTAVQRVVELQSRRGVGVVHLFLAVPGTLAVLLGQQLTNLGIVQVYDFDNDRRKYTPVFTLTHS